MPRHKSDAIAETGRLARAHKDEHRDAALAMGLAPGMRVRFREAPQEGFEQFGGVEHYGVVKLINHDHVVVEQTASVYDGEGRQRSIMKGGKDIVLDDYKVPFSCVKEVLGPGRLARPKPEAPRAVAAAPDREGGYECCDFDKQPIREVVRTSKGTFALCKEHAENPHPLDKQYNCAQDGDSACPVPFKYTLGLVYETYRAWPRPKKDEG